jgi:hypothetical protein
MSARDIYMRHTSPEGKSYVMEHRVWDAERFVAACAAAAVTVNEKQDAGKPRLAKSEQITRDQYLAERKAQ